MDAIPRAKTVAAALLAIGFAIGLSGILHDTPTVDEFAHLPAGCALLAHGSAWLYNHDPPLTRVLMAVPALLAGAEVPRPDESHVTEWTPWNYGTEFMHANRERYLSLWVWARLPILLITLTGGAVLFAFARGLFGDATALLALFLYVFCPNLQAHGRLATPDGPATATILATVFALHRYAGRPSRKRLLVASIALAAAILTKFTGLLLVPVVAALLVVAARADGIRGGAFWKRWARELAVIGGVVLLAVNAAYLLTGSFTSLETYTFQSGFLKSLQELLPGALPVPLPRELVLGFDVQKMMTERGEFGTYFGGEWTREGPWYYNLAALALKLPLPVLVLLGASAVLWLKPAGDSSGTRLRGRDIVFLALPPAFLVLVFTAFNNLNVGVRYLLPIFPFLFLFAARIVSGARLRPRPGGPVLLAAACAVALVVSTLLVHPHQLSFFNVLAGGAEDGHRWLLDSNLDWGQDLSEVPAYLDARGLSAVHLLYFGHVEPALYGIAYTFPQPDPAPGTYIVSANFANGYGYVAPDHWKSVRVPGGAPEWLKTREPKGRIGYSLWVYELD